MVAWLAMTLVAILVSLGLGEPIRRGIFDAWQASSPRDLSDSDVRVVLIDNDSIEALGTWPWPRYYLARLTEELAARRAKVIAFDILFSETDPNGPNTFASLYPELGPAASAEVRALEPMDQLFGKVIGAAPVILGHAGTAKAPAGQPVMASDDISGSLPPKIDSWPAELAAIPELDDVALGHGLLNARPDDDGVIRSAPLVMLAGGKPRPGFALEIARQMLDVDRIVTTPSSVRLGGHTIPVDAHGRMKLHFGRFPADKIFSAADLLGSNAPGSEAFAGRAVLIGLSGEGTTDIAATPLAAEEYGPLVQAQAVDAVLRAGWLDRPPWATVAEWALAAILAVSALGVAIFNRPYRFALAILFLAIPLASWLAFRNAALLLDPARPLIIGGGSVAGVALGLFALARIERERLREALVEERIATAETEGELQAARAIQLAMVPKRSMLHALDDRVDLDALLEPAKSVGGDFYDAMKLGDDKLGFAVADVTGKGVPAALFMAMSKALSSAALSRVDGNAARIAAVINSELLKDNSEAMSVTMLLGILDLRSGEVQVVSAGHEDPFLLSADGQATRICLEGGPPFCITEYSYPNESVTLKPGETLVLITDGVSEAQDAAGRLFGRDRILGSDEERGNAVAICERIRDEIREFEEGAEATDDLTVMAIRFLGPCEPA
jgi:serine phosphatase RsbU (regulator of sigma subunit)/CHASE2 domain-containing sensor protein